MLKLQCWKIKLLSLSSQIDRQIDRYSALLVALLSSHGFLSLSHTESVYVHINIVIVNIPISDICTPLKTKQQSHSIFVTLNKPPNPRVLSIKNSTKKKYKNRNTDIYTYMLMYKCFKTMYVYRNEILFTHYKIR